MTERAVGGLLDELAEKIAAKIGGNGVKVRLMTTKAAAAYLGITENALRQWVAVGKLPTVRADRHLRFDVKDLDNLIEENKHRGI